MDGKVGQVLDSIQAEEEDPDSDGLGPAAAEPPGEAGGDLAAENSKSSESKKNEEAAKKQLQEEEEAKISDEISNWQSRHDRLKALEDQLDTYWIQKSLQVLRTANVPEVDEFKRQYGRVHILLEEAQDNVKFLSTIGKPTDLLSTFNGFQ